MIKSLTFKSVLNTLVCVFCVKAHGNVVGIGAQNFNSIPSGVDFATVHSAQTLDPGIINLGFFLNYAVNTLPYFANSESDRLNFKDGLLSSDFNIGVGVFENFELGLSLPAVLMQNEKDNEYRGEFLNPGFTEIRLLSKYQFIKSKFGSAAFVFSTNFNRVRNDPMAGLGAGPTLNLELAASHQWGAWIYGLNLGYRKRNPGTALEANPIAPLGDQFIASMALSYLLPRLDSKLIAEIFTGFPVGTQTNDLSQRSSSSAEISLGLKHDFSTQFSILGGLGTELVHAQSSPDWRIYTGVNYSFGPYWNKNPTYSNKEKDFYILNNIEFQFNSDEMISESQKALELLVVELQKAPGFSFLSIEGHTDSVGPEEYNKSLSLKRAEAIKKYLVKVHGFKAEKISALGSGEEKPLADNSNYQGRQRNRRVEFRLTR